METSRSTRSLGVLSATSLVISSMVGAGVYVTSGFALADLGTPERVLLAWVVGAMIALCGAIGYGCLARHFQESGGEYLFLSRTVHPMAGFLAGCVSLFAGFTGAIAFAALTFEVYCRDLLPQLADLPSGAIAIVAIVLATLQHLFHVGWGARVLNTLVLVKFLMLLLFLGIAAGQFPMGWNGWSTTAEQAVVESNSMESTAALSSAIPADGVTAEAAVPSFSLVTLAMSLVWISLSYSGFNAAVYVAGETKQPTQVVPRALLGGTLLVSLLYLALNFVFVWAPPSAAIAGQEQVATIAAETLGGSGLSLAMRFTILISLFTSVSVMIMTGPRVYAQMAKEGVFPRWLQFRGPVPRKSVLFQAGLAAVVVLFSTLQQLLTALGLALSLSAALTVASLFRLPTTAQEPLWKRVAALLYVIGTLGIAGLAATRNPWESGAGVLAVLACLIVYALMAKERCRVHEMHH